MRPASVEDARLVAELQLLVWREAFAAVLPAAALNTDLDEHAGSWANRIAQGGPVLVAVEGGEPVGFAAVGAEVDQWNLLDPVGDRAAPTGRPVRAVVDPAGGHRDGPFPARRRLVRGRAAPGAGDRRRTP